MTEISLLSCDLPLLELAVENPAALEVRLGAHIASNREDFASAMKVSREKLQANPALSGWWTHLVIFGVPPVIVGVAGYTGPPTTDGAVEIAYAIAPSYQGRGLATQAARELIRECDLSSKATTCIPRKEETCPDGIRETKKSKLKLARKFPKNFSAEPIGRFGRAFDLRTLAPLS